MPIECKCPLKKLSQDEFHAIDKVMMGHAFDIHNEFGRFRDERIYQDELARRCAESGLPVLREPMICVKYLDFSKQYFLDVLADSGAICELKAVRSLNVGHEMQVINYLLLTELCHGKLVNMRTSSVESRYISTQLNHEKRRRYIYNLNGKGTPDPGALRLYDLLNDLLADWGAFLDIHLAGYQVDASGPCI